MYLIPKEKVPNKHRTCGPFGLVVQFQKMEIILGLYGHMHCIFTDFLRLVSSSITSLMTKRIDTYINRSKLVLLDKVIEFLNAVWSSLFN